MTDETRKRRRKKSQFAMVWERLKRNRMAIAGLVILSIIVLSAIFADVLFDYEAMAVHQNASNRLAAPSAEHWLGTDEVGRDILARIVFGGKGIPPCRASNHSHRCRRRRAAWRNRRIRPPYGR